MAKTYIEGINNNDKLKRVDNGVFEAAQAGIEYESPNQQGSIFGFVFRRYYAIPDGAGVGASVNVSLGFTITGDVVNLNGLCVVTLEGGGEWVPLPASDYGGGARNLELSINTTTINIHGGSLLDWQAGGFISVDYTK